MDVIALAKLNPVMVESEMMALARSLSMPNQTNLIMDIGAKATDIAIAKNENLVFTRTIPTAGDAFTRAVSQGLGIETVRAEEYRNTYGLNQTQLEGKVFEALRPIMQLTSDEVKKAIHYYQSEEGGDYPQSVIITGGASAIPGMVNTFSQMLGMEVVIANPFSKVSLSSEASKNVSNYAHFYGIAVGLAQRS